MTDEEWIGFNALDDEGFRNRMKSDFDLDIHIKAEDTSASTAASAK